MSYPRLTLLLSLTVCAVTHAAAENMFMVDQAWLRANLARDDVVVVDTREPEAFAAGHIEGAVSLPVAATYSQEARTDLLAPISVIKELLRETGIRNEDHLVLYDDGDFDDAARVFWVFEVYGHRRISILNDGFDAWAAQTGPTTRQARPRKRSSYLPSVNPRRLATKRSTQIATQSDEVVLIDARSEAEYLGLQSIAARRGHIPSARNIPATGLIAGTRTQFRSLAELGRMFDDIPRNKQVITYCNKGQYAAMAYFTLRSLGYDVAAYDGSWYEWGNDHSLPIEREH